MTVSGPSINYFVLEAFDREQWCPVLQSRLEVVDIKALQMILGAQADEDPELRHVYTLDEAELAAIIAGFGEPFDPTRLKVWIPTKPPGYTEVMSPAVPI